MLDRARAALRHECDVTCRSVVQDFQIFPDRHLRSLESAAPGRGPDTAVSIYEFENGSSAFFVQHDHLLSAPHNRLSSAERHCFHCNFPLFDSVYFRLYLNLDR